ncbi:metal-binding protein [Halorubrum sp. SS5]|nr:metal-binding protein [Halorubrum sp. SS5]
MNCRRCGTPLEKPGDYCLTCNTANADAVVAEFEPDRARLTLLDEDDVVGETTVTTRPEDRERLSEVQLRNFAGRVADEIRRKRPETVYAAGEREPLRETRAQLHHEFYRVPDGGASEGAHDGAGTAGDPSDDDREADVSPVVRWVLDRRGDRSLAVVETPPREKIGGSHSTLIGDRKGRKAVQTVAEHPHVKKIVPGPIDAGGTGSRTGLRAKATRAGTNGNVRLLLRDGSSVQENRIVTTAMDRETGERVREDLNEALRDAELQDA